MPKDPYANSPVDDWGTVAVLAAMPVAAQETRGNISGTVSDASGVVPGATIRVTNVDTGVSQRLTTNGSGYFEAPLLNPGNYQVTVEMIGFQDPVPERHHALGRPAGLPATHAGSGHARRAGRGHGERAPAGHEHRPLRAAVRTAPGAGPADALEHARPARPHRLGRERQRAGTFRGAGIRRRPVRPGGRDWRRGKHGIHHRRRDQQRTEPAAGDLSERRHDSGDADRDVQFRRRGGPWIRAGHLDDDPGRHQSETGHRDTISIGPTS